MLLKGTLLYNMPAYYASIICWHILLIRCWVATCGMAEQTTAHTELALPPFKGQQRAQERLLCLCDWGHFRRGGKKSVPQQFQSITLFPFPYFQMVVDHKNTDPCIFICIRIVVYCCVKMTLSAPDISPRTFWETKECDKTSFFSSLLNLATNITIPLNTTTIL